MDNEVLVEKDLLSIEVMGDDIMRGGDTLMVLESLIENFEQKGNLTKTEVRYHKNICAREGFQYREAKEGGLFGVLYKVVAAIIKALFEFIKRLGCFIARLFGIKGLCKDSGSSSSTGSVERKVEKAKKAEQHIKEVVAKQTPEEKKYYIDKVITDPDILGKFPAATDTVLTGIAYKLDGHKAVVKRLNNQSRLLKNIAVRLRDVSGSSNFKVGKTVDAEGIKTLADKFMGAFDHYSVIGGQRVFEPVGKITEGQRIGEIITTEYTSEQAFYGIDKFKVIKQERSVPWERGGGRNYLYTYLYSLRIEGGEPLPPNTKPLEGKHMRLEDIGTCITDAIVATTALKDSMEDLFEWCEAIKESMVVLGKHVDRLKADFGTDGDEHIIGIVPKHRTEEEERDYAPSVIKMLIKFMDTSTKITVFEGMFAAKLVKTYIAALDDAELLQRVMTAD